ncbi:hypothetical protein [Streptomyces sp. MS2.AVA.5]|uniref:Uncharacterized protein n=1 Tax=Streptomyces achmelvichensis TaxID=3134111 RepID=A0ACC6PSD6_9ACTN
MAFLMAVVALVGALCLFDLLLTFAVLRRLREHTAELERLGGRPSFVAPDAGVLIGRRIAEAASAHASRLVAFFDAQCETCHEHAPAFAARAQAHGGLAVVSGKGDLADELIGHVDAHAVVIRGEEATRLVSAMDIQAFPTFVLVDEEGYVVSAATELAELAEPTAAV